MSDIDEITERLTAGEPATRIAATLGLDIAEEGDHEGEGVAVVLPGWHGDDGNFEVEMLYPDTAEEAAQEYVDGGDWGEHDETYWIDVWVWRRGLAEDDGELVAVRCYEQQRTVQVDPVEPDCLDEEGHDWQAPHEIVGGLRENPGVRGHGAGLICTSVCPHCDAVMIRDTWAQRRDTGEQGLTSLRYSTREEEGLPAEREEER